MERFNDYGDHIKRNDLGTGTTENEKIMYYVLGLTEEAGEVAGKVKKSIRDSWSTRKTREEVCKEAGDTLWYLTRLCAQYDLTLEEVAAANIEKTDSRHARGMIRGEGDNR